jgi:hypothetical protein
MDSGRCRQADKCLGAERTEDGVLLAADAHGDPFCGPCARRVGESIRALTVDYLYLSLMSGVTSQAGDGIMVNGSRELKVPLRLEVTGLQAAIDLTVSQWVEPVAERVNVPWDTRLMSMARPGYRVQQSARILYLALDVLVTLEPTEVLAWVDPVGVMVTTRDGAEGAQELMELHRRALWWTRGNSGDVRLPIPCPCCEARTLVRENGTDGVRCRGCGAVLTDDQYRHFGMVEMEKVNQ